MIEIIIREIYISCRTFNLVSVLDCLRKRQNPYLDSKIGFRIFHSENASYTTSSRFMQE